MSLRLQLAVGFSLLAATGLACKVPVFRYALERWNVDRYRLVAIVEGDHGESVDGALEQLRSIDQLTNAQVEIVDLAKLSDQELWQLEDFDGSADPPLLQIFYPPKDGKRIKCWEGPLRADSVSAWLDSPLRRQIASDLIAGSSAVFLLVDGVDQPQSDEIADKLQQSLAQAASQIKIPDGVIPRAEAAEYLQQHPEATMDDVLRCDIPLQVKFSLRRLSRDDPRELAVTAMIHGLMDDAQGPIVVPIFGRGRMLDAINAVDCDDDVIMNICRYIVGECSCTVKALNPGVDLMLAVNWSDRLGQSVVMIDPQPSDEPNLITIPQGRSAAVADRLGWDPVSAILVGAGGLALVTFSGLAVWFTRVHLRS